MAKISIRSGKLYYGPPPDYKPIKMPDVEIDVEKWLKEYHPEPATPEQWILAAKWQKAMGIGKDKTE